VRKLLFIRAAALALEPCRRGLGLRRLPKRSFT
jgi:hypothetical protein